MTFLNEKAANAAYVLFFSLCAVAIGTSIHAHIMNAAAPGVWIPIDWKFNLGVYLPPIGIIGWLAGSCMLAKAKGYSPAWGIFGLTVLGTLVLFFLPIRSPNPISSSTDQLSEYDKLRAAVGMAPAEENDIHETVTWVIVFDLLAEEVANECNRLPQGERKAFMQTYAAYLTWLVSDTIISRFDQSSWTPIVPLLMREFAKNNWYEEKAATSIYDAMNDHPPRGSLKGRYSGISSGPWFEAVATAQLVGLPLSQPDNLEFMLYVTIRTANIVETITKIIS